ncbi:sigma-70 family RNA polymerase sigma factor [Asticcacaulis sp. BYS171W]|uniref:Sigma-70 family RNA polymerase sigma factor n=1 Tax=Asticcacaulis aquaticus TaxID=2984212 RepID=A0ABT5HWT0_9CAUL|nr:sigma-70 family RNA polymerase sigma factor [Asticcacaulis aquaticus]MDC7684535.1 sigma-70 family RNA polymerase sigma factor [Asticcacaulis aquaticus]
MAGLPQMLDKARRAILRKGVAVQDADDLVQEAFLRVEAFERTQTVKSPEALLIRTAVNLSFDMARRRKVAPFVDMGDDAGTARDHTPLPDEILRGQERLQRAAQGLERLPEKTRRILLSRRLDGKSFKEIAAAEGMTVAAVEKQVARATLELTKWMEAW